METQYLMKPARKHGKVNVKLLIVIISVVVILGVGAFVARHVRREVLASRELVAGTAAYDKQDWPTACRHLGGYLSRRPQDAEIWKKYAQAQLSVQPVTAGNARAAIGAYRKLMVLTPDDAEVYARLAQLYLYSGDHAELAYVAQRRLDQAPDDRRARIWKAKSLIARRRYDELAKEEGIKEGILKPLLLMSFVEGKATDSSVNPSAKKCPECIEACELMSLVAGGQNDALTVLIERWRHQIWTFIDRMCGYLGRTDDIFGCLFALQRASGD